MYGIRSDRIQAIAQFICFKIFIVIEILIQRDSVWEHERYFT